MRTTIAFFLLLLGLFAMYGCGASVIETHMKAAQVTRSALDASKYIIEKAAEESAVAEMSNKNVDVHQAELNAHDALRHFEKARALQNKAVSLYQIWVTSLVSAYSKNEDPSAMSIWYSLAMETFHAYKEMVIEAIKVGLKVPGIDSVMKEVSQ